MKYWTYVLTGRDVQDDGRIGPEHVLDDAMTLFGTKRQAFLAAEQAARQEADSLNENCDDGISFGVAEDDDWQNGDEVKVLCYSIDDTTELVTRRSIRIIQEPRRRT